MISDTFEKGLTVDKPETMAPRNDPKERTYAPLKRDRKEADILTDAEELLSVPETPREKRRRVQSYSTPESVPADHGQNDSSSDDSDDEEDKRQVVPETPASSGGSSQDEEECVVRVYITDKMRERLKADKGFTLKFV